LVAAEDAIDLDEIVSPPPSEDAQFGEPAKFLRRRVVQLAEVGGERQELIVPLEPLAKFPEREEFPVFLRSGASSA